MLAQSGGPLYRGGETPRVASEFVTISELAALDVTAVSGKPANRI